LEKQIDKAIEQYGFLVWKIAYYLRVNTEVEWEVLDKEEGRVIFNSSPKISF